MKKENIKEYTIMEAQPAALKKANNYRRILFYVNLPLIVGIPAFVEWGLPAIQKTDVSILYVVLHLTDFFLCFNSLIIYSTINKLVTAIKYLPDEHKIKIKQCTDWFLKEKETTYDPKEVIKCKKQVLNPFIGYRNVTNVGEKYATESTSLWHDRQFFDSIIFREVNRKAVRPRKT